MKIIGFERIDRGLVVHTPAGTRTPWVATGPDASAELGKLVLSVVEDEAQPEAAPETPGRRSKRGTMGGRRRSERSRNVDFASDIDVPERRPGETHEEYVNRVATKLGLGAAKKAWNLLQRLSR